MIYIPCALCIRESMAYSEDAEMSHMHRQMETSKYQFYRKKNHGFRTTSPIRKQKISPK